MGWFMAKRFKVICIGLAGGAVFALWVAAVLMPSGMEFTSRVLVWAAVFGGPVLGTAWETVRYHPVIGLGWLGLLLAPSHPVRPHWATGLMTVAGLVLWFFAGFITVVVAVWGA